MKHFARAAALIAALTTGIGSAAAAPSADASLVDFANPDPVLTIKDALTPYHGPSATEPDGSNWYLIRATNSAVRPVSRVLQATQAPSVSFRILPRPTRPAIVGVASSDSAVNIENLNAYGRRAYRVIIPPATSVPSSFRWPMQPSRRRSWPGPSPRSPP